MTTEQKKVLDMLESGQITNEEAARLLDCLEQDFRKEPAPAAPRPAPVQAGKKMKGKKLRIQVDGHVEGDKKINANVSIPLVLARYADNIIANCVPREANKELMEQGIDLRSLNISQIVDTIEDIDEDILNADIDQEDTVLKVRIYVE